MQDLQEYIKIPSNNELETLKLKININYIKTAIINYYHELNRGIPFNVNNINVEVLTRKFLAAEGFPIESHIAQPENTCFAESVISRIATEIKKLLNEALSSILADAFEERKQIIESLQRENNQLKNTVFSYEQQISSLLQKINILERNSINQLPRIEGMDIDRSSPPPNRYSQWQQGQVQTTQTNSSNQMESSISSNQTMK